MSKDRIERNEMNVIEKKDNDSSVGFVVFVAVVVVILFILAYHLL